MTTASTPFSHSRSQTSKQLISTTQFRSSWWEIFLSFKARRNFPTRCYFCQTIQPTKRIQSSNFYSKGSLCRSTEHPATKLEHHTMLSKPNKQMRAISLPALVFQISLRSCNNVICSLSWMVVLICIKPKVKASELIKATSTLSHLESKRAF